MERSKWATPPSSAPPIPKPAQAQDINHVVPTVTAEATEVLPMPEVKQAHPTPEAAATTTSIPDPPEVPSQPLPILDPHSSFDGSGDEFAHTRPPDDLFSDDFEPISDPIVEELSVPIQQVTSQSKPLKRSPRTPGTNAQPKAAAAEVKPQGPDGPRTEAVRGDRSGTGGVKKTKLTEEELSARMEAIKLKNQSLEAAHARAEADEASFNAREAEAQQKRKVERQNRQQMMGERERNRQRKMNALGGREWDATKDEEDLADPVRGSQYRRGAHGGIAMDIRPASDIPDSPPESYGERGRGGRGRAGRARGQGFAGRGNGHESHPKPTPQSVPTPADFPSLPGSSTAQTQPTTQKASKTPQSSDTPKPANLDPTTNGTSWAEEMENPVAAISSA